MPLSIGAITMPVLRVRDRIAFLPVPSSQLDDLKRRYAS